MRHGIRVRVVDRLADPPQYAKAVGIQPRTLEMWERTGLLGDALGVKAQWTPEESH